MTKNQIQESRMKSYFLTAAKEMIRGEGIKSISVRNIADRAGYSYATLYNYFKDLNQLLMECIEDFADECIEFTKFSEAGMSTEEIYRKKTLSFINYFVQYPATFELIFTERTDYKYAVNKSKDIIYNIYNVVFEKVVSNLYNDSDKAKIMFFLHRNVIHSILSFYLLRFNPGSYKEMINEVEYFFRIMEEK